MIVLRNGQIVDMKVEPTRFAGLLDVQGNRERERERARSQNSKVLDWTPGSMELAFIEMGKETGLGRTPRVWFLSFFFFFLRFWFRTS